MEITTMKLVVDKWFRANNYYSHQFLKATENPHEKQSKVSIKSLDVQSTIVNWNHWFEIR